MLYLEAQKKSRKPRWPAISGGDDENDAVKVAPAYHRRGGESESGFRSFEPRKDRAMTAAPIVLRLYEAIGLIFPDGAVMPPPDATAPAPNCICCRQPSPLPPGKVGWLKSEGGALTLLLVCGECAADCNDDQALEARILTAIRASTDVASTPIVEAPPAPAEAAPRVGIGSPPTVAVRPVPASEAWVRAAAQEWTQQPPAA
jgi:hypothetical protein